MNDEHIIRVIIQGYNKLSGVLKDAVDQSTPHLDRLNDRLNRNKRQAQDYESAWTKMSRTVERGATEFDVAAIKIERLTNRMREFTRRTKESNAETQKQQSLLSRAIDQKNRLFDGKSPFDDVLRGLRKGAERPEGNNATDRAQLELQKKLADLRNEEATQLARVNKEEEKRRRDAQAAALKEANAIRDRLLLSDKELDQMRSKLEEQSKITREIKRSERRDALRAVTGDTDEARAQREKIKTDAITEAAVRERAEKDEIRTIERERARLHAQALSDIKTESSAQISSANAIATKNRTIVRETFNERRRVARQDFSTNRENLPGLIAKGEREARDSINNIDKFVERSAARVGKASSDISYGFTGARKGLKEFEGEAGRAQSIAAQLGARFGEATKDINKLVNVRWSLIISAIQTIGTLAVIVGANLISLASSAVFAAGALGAAFIAAAAQAVPVVGLLAATFQELQNAIKVVQLRQKANDSASVDATAQAKAQKSAVQGLADAHYSLKQAQQGVLDANLGLRDSHERVTDALRAQTEANTGLAKARKDAARAIVDAAFAERDAELSVRDANLGVLDAKQKLRDFERKNSLNDSGLKDAQAAVKEAQQRLQAAKTEGDAAEISAATGQLSIAAQNVSAIQDQVGATALEHKQLILGVAQAQQTQKQAIVTRRRAIQDNALRQKQGVEKSPEVISALDTQRNANRQVRDSIEQVSAAERRRADAEHSVALAIRGISNAQDSVTAASDKMSAAQRNAQREFNKLSLPERNFVRAAERLVRAWKTLIRPLTDIITNAVTRLIDNVIKILHDPRIHNALTGLATAIANGIGKIGDFLSNPETRRQLTTFITEATKNLPTVVDLFLAILKIVMNIAEAAGPIFGGLLGGAESLLGRAERWTAPRRSQKAPNDPRLSRLEAPGQTTPGSTSKETSPLERFLSVASKNLNSWLKLIGAITRFFTYLFGGAEPSGNSLVGMLTEAFNKWADWLRDHPEKVRKFFEDMRIALGKIAHVLGPLAVQLLNAFSSKGAQNFTEFVLTVVIPALLLMIGIVQFFVGLLVGLTKLPVVGGVFKFIITLLFGISLLAKLFPVIKLATFLFDGIALAVEAFGLAIVGWIIVIPLIIAGIILLLRHFHLLGPAVHLVVEILKSSFGLMIDLVKAFVGGFIEFLTHPIRWIRNNWKSGVVNGIFAPFTTVLRLLNRFFPGFTSAIYNGFIGAFKKIGDWFRGIGEWLNAHIIKPIEHFFGIASPSALMFKLGMNVVNGFLNAIKKIPGLVVGVFKKIPNLVTGLFKGLGKDVANLIVDAIPAPIRRGLGIAKDVGSKAVGAVKSIFKASGGPIDGPRGTDTVPAWLTPGEWVLNKSQQLQVSKRLGVSVDAARMMLFGSKGASPSATVSGNTVSEHGRWTGYHNFDVHTSVDDSGIPVNFIRFKDGTWGQITARAAARIAATQGSWTPGYASRASRLHGGLFETKRLASVSRGLRSDAFDRRFAMGGVVSAMAAGSNVGAQTFSPAGSRGGNSVTQNFNVNSQGDSDWNGIMRIGAIHAQESY